MYLSRSTLRNTLLGTTGILILFLSFSYSDESMVGFSDFSFLSGGNEVDTLYFEMTGGDTTGFSVVVYNKEDTSMTYRLGFVDAGISNDSFAHPSCLSPNETGNFGLYVSGNTSLFTLPVSGSRTEQLSVNFPSYYSGIYHGCIMYFPTHTALNTNPGSPSNIALDVHTLPRRGGFIDVLVHPNMIKLVVKAFPSNRVYQSTNKANIGVIKLYDSNKNRIATSLPFTLNSAGTGEALITAPAGSYYIAFKGQSHLASYLDGVAISEGGGDTLDFTTGTNLHNTQDLNSAEDDGEQYQTAGDLKSSAGNYDFQINGNDIAILTANGFQESGIPVLDARNLNGDTALNVSDISVIGVNFAKTDPFFVDNQTFTW